MGNVASAAQDAAETLAEPYDADVFAAGAAKYATLALEAALVSTGAVEDDLRYITNGFSSDSLAMLPIWPIGMPDKVRALWGSLRRELLEQDRNWDVWTRWYDAVLDGKPTPCGQELDIYRVTLDSEDDWKKGPAQVNALIRKKEEEIAGRTQRVVPFPDHLTTPEELAELASPQPHESEDGKLGVAPNVTFDIPTADVDLTTLPLRQQRIIDVILSDLPLQSPRHLRPSLQHYGDELKARGTQPILGILKDMAEIVIAACAANDDDWIAAGLRTSFELFTRNHDLLMKHFPLDDRREQRYAEIEVTEDSVSGRKLVEPFREAVESLKAADVTTPNAQLVLERMVEIAEITAYVPSGALHLYDLGAVVPDGAHRWSRVSTKKRLILQARGFFEGALPILVRAGLTIDALDKIRKLLDLLRLFFPG